MTSWSRSPSSRSSGRQPWPVSLTRAEIDRPTPMMTELELSVVIPCLNEAEALSVVVRKAVKTMEELGIDGEVIVADNGSTDGSQAIAVESGARVVEVPERGYGSAIAGGTA